MFTKAESANLIDTLIGYGLFFAWYAFNEVIDKQKRRNSNDSKAIHRTIQR